MPPEARPWANFVTMELLVALIIMVLFAMLQPRLSADNPGKLQHTFEMIYEFLHGESEGTGGPRRSALHRLLRDHFHLHPVHEPDRRGPGIRIADHVAVGSRWAAPLATFLYYNIVGIQANGSRQVPGAFRRSDAVAGAADGARSS